MIKSGVYIVKYGDNSIKIGRSKNVHKRLQSYKGYTQYGQDIEKLLLVFAENHRQLEKWSHQYAVVNNLIRINKCEVFQVNDIIEFIDKYKQDVKQNFGDCVYIEDKFQKQEEFKLIQKSNQQNNIKQKEAIKKLEEFTPQIKNETISNQEQQTTNINPHNIVCEYLDQFRYGNNVVIIKPLNTFYVQKKMEQLQI